MIFARRAIQRRLDELRSVLSEQTVSTLVSRLNRPGKDCLAAMWEVAILHSLSNLGKLRNELELVSGRKPDVAFDNGVLAFTADVTSVSDDGLDEQNPFEELSELIEAAKTRMGLKIGGMDLQVESRTVQTARGNKRVLRLPNRRRLREFVHNEIEPRLRQQIAQGKQILEIIIDDETAGIKVRIDPSRSPYNGGYYAAYDVPTIKDRNPLYNALHNKANQLRGASGLLGVIVGDGDSRTLAATQNSWSEVSARTIADEFLRQHTSMHFVLFLSVRETWPSLMQVGTPDRNLEGLLTFSKRTAVPSGLEDLFRQMMAEMPQPIAMPVNGARRAREPGYGLGHRGGHEMSSKHIKMSAREVMELLAGRRSVQQFNASHRWSSPNETPLANTRLNPFERFLQEGRLPLSISIIKTDENDSDDWIEIKFDDADPAISPFR